MTKTVSFGNRFAKSSVSFIHHPFQTFRDKGSNIDKDLWQWRTGRGGKVFWLPNRIEFFLTFTVILYIDLQRLLGAPPFDRSKVMNMSLGQWEEIYRYFGLVPFWQEEEAGWDIASR